MFKEIARTLNEEIVKKKIEQEWFNSWFFQRQAYIFNSPLENTKGHKRRGAEEVQIERAFSTPISQKDETPKTGDREREKKEREGRGERREKQGLLTQHTAINVATCEQQHSEAGRQGSTRSRPPSGRCRGKISFRKVQNGLFHSLQKPLSTL